MQPNCSHKKTNRGTAENLILRKMLFPKRTSTVSRKKPGFSNLVFTISAKPRNSKILIPTPIIKLSFMGDRDKNFEVLMLRSRDITQTKFVEEEKWLLMGHTLYSIKLKFSRDFKLISTTCRHFHV